MVVLCTPLEVRVRGVSDLARGFGKKVKGRKERRLRKENGHALVDIPE